MSVANEIPEEVDPARTQHPVFRAEQATFPATYWTILGPDGEVGWGVEYSEQSAADRVRFLTKAYEAGRASR